jgi:hypothetical protein
MDLIIVAMKDGWIGTNMKIAVCISGACKGTDIVANNQKLKAKFPNADFYYATWNSYKDTFEKHFPQEKCLFFEEYKMTYDPYIDIPVEERVSPWLQMYIDMIIQYNLGERLSHGTKQIMIHHWLADTIKDKYDIIIRTRFDLLLSDIADFTPYVEDTFQQQRANGFAGYEFKIDELFGRDLESTDFYYNRWLCDMLIIHPSVAIDLPFVTQLHERKLLHAGEFGWYQTLSRPFGSKHRCYEGWVQKDGPPITAT